jgi:putative isomerase
MSMDIDLQQVPFSRRGSYFAISRLENRVGIPDGLYLRTVHGDATTNEIFSISLRRGPDLLTCTETAAPEKLVLEAEDGSIEICIATPTRVLLRGRGVGLVLTALLRSNYDLAVQVGPNRWQYVCHASNMNLMITAHQGDLRVSANWSGVKDDSLELLVAPTQDSGEFAVSIDEFGTSFEAEAAPENFDAATREARADFEAWERLTPPVPANYEQARSLAAYVNWCSIVEPKGYVRRQSMLMSKNWMTNVWSWDHCFNAMALNADPAAAIDQFMTMFDNQDEHGALPDYFSDGAISHNFTKPAIHGWALDWLMRRTSFDEPFLITAYDVLTQWTNWWFKYRDHDGDGFPQYNHGNDSGWDNSTAFRRFVPIESPDQVAFLVIQMEVLAAIAGRLGRPAEQTDWAERSARLLSRLLDEFWVDGHFIARHALTHEAVVCDSLLMYIPLVLGDRLPRDVFDTLADGLAQNGFLTEFGLATESTSSPYYESDGYWRGPIWAPSTMIIVDGLFRGGREEVARDIARRFCSLVGRSGMAENFDALSGDGLRDRAYTWTASVFLVLASEYAGAVSDSGR